MSGSEKAHSGLTRRSFLRATGVTAAAATLPCSMGALTAVANEEAPAGASDALETGFCFCEGACQGNCLLNGTAENGKLVQVLAGDMGDFTRICVRGASHAQRIYTEDRVKYPMRRSGERGAGEWERITWDEAIEEIAQRFSSLTEEYGSSSICFLTVGGMTSRVDTSAMTRLRNAIGATNVSYSYDHIGRLGLQWAMPAYSTWNTSPWGIAGLPTNWKQANSFIIWMTNPPWSNPHSWRYVLDAKQDHHAKMIAIDPNFTPAAAQSDVHVSLRPGSDTAFALGMCKVIVDNDWIDRDFLLEHTCAPFLVRDDTGAFLRARDLDEHASDPDQYVVLEEAQLALLGEYPLQIPDLSGKVEVNGVKCETAFDKLVKHLESYSPELVADICDIEPELVVETADTYANMKPSTIITGRNHWDNGVPWGHALAVLAALTNGVIGKGNSVGEIAVIVPSLGGTALSMPNDTSRVPEDGDIPQMMMSRIIETGKWRGEDYPLKALWVYGANPVTNLGNQNSHIEDVIKKLDFIVCSDVMYTDTAKWADIVLPISYWFEKEGVMAPNLTPYIIHSDKLVEPAFETKADWEIAVAVGKAMGFTDDFDFTFEDAAEWSISDVGREKGLTLEKLREEKKFQDLPDDYLQSYWADASFNSPSKRIEFWVENPVVRYDIGVDVDTSPYHLPFFQEPYEAWPTNPLFEKYPFVMLGQRGKWHLHSQFHTTPALRELCTEPFVQINPNDAAKLGISDGDIVELYNDRGHAVLKAILDASMREGVITAEKCWNSDSFIDGNIQELTQDYLNPLHCNISYFDVLCGIRKFEGGDQ